MRRELSLAQVAELAAALATVTSSGAADVEVAAYVDNDGLLAPGELEAEAAAYAKVAENVNATCTYAVGDRASNRMPQPLNGRTLWASPDPAAPAAPAAPAGAASAGARGARAAAAVAAVAAAAALGA